MLDPHDDRARFHHRCRTSDVRCGCPHDLCQRALGQPHHGARRINTFLEDGKWLLSISIAVAASAIAIGLDAYLLSYFSLDAEDDLPLAERRRRQDLRAQSKLYRLFEPSVQAASRVLPRPGADRHATRRRPFGDPGAAAHWKPEEAAAIAQIQAISVVFSGLAGNALLRAGGWSDDRGAEPARHAVAAFAGPGQKSARTGRQNPQALPFTLDLAALLLEAGSGIACALPGCGRAAENAGHPLGSELQRVLMAIEQGAAQADALRELDSRLGDGDIKELVLTLNTAEERGIALKSVLRELAERIRVRQIQWIERSSEQAKVKINLPAMLVMAACLLLILTPLVLLAMNGG